MDLATQLRQARNQQFVALILDNEVTVGEFVTEPPLPWARIVQQDGVFQIAEGYPKVLDAALGKAEMKNWDEVSLAGIVRTLAELTDAVDYVVIGNNAGQGLPLAQAVPQELRAARRELFTPAVCRNRALTNVWVIRTSFTVMRPRRACWPRRRRRTGRWRSIS